MIVVVVVPPAGLLLSAAVLSFRVSPAIVVPPILPFVAPAVVTRAAVMLVKGMLICRVRFRPAAALIAIDGVGQRLCEQVQAARRIENYGLASPFWLAVKGAVAVGLLLLHS